MCPGVSVYVHDALSSEHVSLRDYAFLRTIGTFIINGDFDLISVCARWWKKIDPENLSFSSDQGEINIVCFKWMDPISLIIISMTVEGRPKQKSWYTQKCCWK